MSSPRYLGPKSPNSRGPWGGGRQSGNNICVRSTVAGLKIVQDPVQIQPCLDPAGYPFAMKRVA